MIKSIVVVLLAVLSCSTDIIANTTSAAAFSQAEGKKKKKKKLSWKKKLKSADYAFQTANYYVAAKYYKEVLEEKPDLVEVKFKLAETSFEIRDFQLAEEKYKEVMDIAGDDFPKAYFMYPLMLKYNGKYEDAKKEFKSFSRRAKAFRDSQEASNYKKQAREEIKGIEFGEEAMENPKPVRVHHLGTTVNAANSEFSPYIRDNELVFSSLRADSFISVSADSQSQANLAQLGYIAKIYKAERINDSIFAQAEPFSDKINSSTDHTGSGSYSSDGKRFFFVRAVKQDESNVIISTIYVTEKDGSGNWKEPVMVTGIGEGTFSNRHPISVNTTYRRKKIEVIYFSSLRSENDGGEGGWDIWYATRPLEGEYDAKFDEPKNVGRRINTLRDEISPFFDLKTNSFYYSSNSPEGLGGYDVYETHGQLKKWAKAQNMGYPINSSVDDMFFTMNDRTTGGYLVSNRKGSIALKHPHCCDDIFSFKYYNRLDIGLEGLVYENINDSTKAVVDSVKVALYITNVDPEYVVDENAKKGESSVEIIKGDDVLIGEFIIAGDPSDQDLNNKMYFFDLNKDKYYKVVASKEGYIADFKFASTQGFTKSDTIRRDLLLRKKTDKIVLKNILYDFDKATLKPASKLTLDTLVQLLQADENAKLIVEIGAHTDSKGDDDYNMTLSQRRAESVVKYLVAAGVAEQRLRAKGYGETQHIAPNENPDGTDNEEGRALNRRTEFKVLGELEEVIYDTEDDSNN